MTSAKIMLGAALALSAGLASAQERPPYGNPISVDQAKRIAAGALAESKKNNWRMAISIVDNHGFPVYFERMEDTQTASIQIALDKAKSAAMFRRPTKVFEDGVAKGRVALLGLTGAMPIEGGLPIMVDGRVIGGIGVSGANADQDAQAAQAGLNALK
ncbi:MAG: heme-binding protein [Betaproteobacteria bacterium]|nr:MAG: heme-binding protein [Betaproteobacteria bacterium]